MNVANEKAALLYACFGIGLTVLGGVAGTIVVLILRWTWRRLARGWDGLMASIHRRKAKRDIERRFKQGGPWPTAAMLETPTLRARRRLGEEVIASMPKATLLKVADSQHAEKARKVGECVTPVIAWHVTYDEVFDSANIATVKPDGTVALPEAAQPYHSVDGQVHHGELRHCAYEPCKQAWTFASCGLLARHCGIPDCPKWLVPALDTVPKAMTDQLTDVLESIKPDDDGRFEVSHDDYREVQRLYRGVDKTKDRAVALRTGGYESQTEPPSELPKVDAGPGPGSLPKKGGYSGSKPASEVPPPPSTPSATIFPRGVEDMLSGAAFAHRRDQGGSGVVHRGAYKDCLEHECLMDPGNPRGVYYRQQHGKPAGQLRTPGPDEPVTENLSDYIEGKAAPQPPRDAFGPLPDSFVHMAPEGGHHKDAGPCGDDCEPIELKPLIPALDGWPDPDKDDCPFWLPSNPLVPHKDRTPCHLDAGHGGQHEPMDQGTVDRAEAILARLPYGATVWEKGGVWDRTAAQYDAEQAQPTDARQWVRLTATCAPPVGQAVKDVDLLEVAKSLGQSFGFELVDNVQVVKVEKAPRVAVKVQ